MPAASFGALLASVAKEECTIKNVWNHNLHEEFRVIRQVADMLAGEAISDGSEVFTIPEFSEVLFKYKKRLWSKWKEHFDVASLEKGIWYRTIHCEPPHVPWFADSKLKRKYIVIAHRLRSGHMPLNCFKYLMKLVDNPNCESCGVKEDVYHLLRECVRSESMREEIFRMFDVNQFDVGLFQSMLAVQTSNAANMLYRAVFDLVVKKFHWVAMDTEFPGVVARPIGEFRSTADYQYQLLRCNVDLLRIIQLGLTFMDENGKTPPGCTTWQFNFKFNLQEDMYAQDSIDLLQNSGLQFREHEEHGIEPLEFAELLMSSGIVLMDNINWLSFHSGYDFGYLLKLLTDKNLPLEENDFFDCLRLYFPKVYDVKYLMKLCKNLKGGLQEVADQLELLRVGPQHQAGSDSHLTGMAFFKIKEIFFDGNIESTSGHLYGLGAPFPTSANILQDNVENGKSS